MSDFFKSRSKHPFFLLAASLFYVVEVADRQGRGGIQTVLFRHSDMACLVIEMSRHHKYVPSSICPVIMSRHHVPSSICPVIKLSRHQIRLRCRNENARDATTHVLLYVVNNAS